VSRSRQGVTVCNWSDGGVDTFTVTAGLSEELQPPLLTVKV
jgi:hypothetical protein